ncbi:MULTISPECIES: NADP-dependent malic enzyme [unclassified Bartonella]|uniref:NADP-dependent malic enzyme n=1 Tax=unclassified Bartonella TaxID=2645622 RepID=UPI0009999978|nr:MULTISPECIES: NADP-dependent malic enzyme [unclassified Bartonella]AQX28090.1 malate dehydrogenase (oxaloacetate-decarboxylating)(NADP+) [Bartonella sp. JB15]AQX29363.1 malate dehydrogenase (oxaloacetate-decarboxylating)(NADP+) [Bartonella sp. JB63]
MSKKQNSNPRLQQTELENAALFYHQHPKPGKLEIQATKPLGNQRDLALAYSPGVAAPCLAIHDDPKLAAQYTSRSNLVAVISNGTAVLGLGNIGPLASKPVMEGKAVLFKKFANIDVFDIELDAPDITKMVETVSALEPTFGGINLEDIKAPECFEIEEQLRAKMNIPVFHDDQHGTAIIACAAVLNALSLADKKIENAKIVSSGAGAAALACINLLVRLGAKVENIWLSDLDGVVYEGRETLMDRWKINYAQKTDARTLADIIDNADIFLGLSAAGVLKPEYLKKMASKPLILALANPTPEIMPEEANTVRPDAMICTGRSDYPNQVNNVLCFPYIFRGALDVGATAINEEMKMAAVHAIAALAREETSDVAACAYSKAPPNFGPEYLIPSPFDPRLILRIAPAVAKAAMESGVAVRPIENMEAYHDILNRFVFRSGLIMKPVFAAAKTAKCKRVIYADGEDERVLRAAQIVLEEQTAIPLLIGRPHVVETRLKRFGLKIRPGIDFEITNPENDPRFRDYVNLFLRYTGRHGVSPEVAKTIVRTSTTAIAALAVMRGEADAMICGLEGRFERNLELIEQIIGLDPNINHFSAVSLLISTRGTLFLTDTYVNENPSAEEIAEMTILAAQEIEAFGIKPKAALLSHSNFGSKNTVSARKMRRATEILAELYPDLEADGEMHGDAALSKILRDRVFPDSRLTSEANLLVFPTLDAANITLNIAKNLTNALHVGPILIGAARPAHILTPSVTSRGVVNMTALAVLAANRKNLAIKQLKTKIM